jgi:hypothetical protein
VIRPAARWRWSRRRLATATAAAAAFGLVDWAVVVRGVGAVLGPAQGPAFGLVVGLVFWLTFALGYGLVPDRSLPPPAPAKALAASLRAAIPPSTVVASAVALAVVLVAAATSSNVADQLRLSLAAPTVLAALLTFWFTGGGAWLGHHTARWAASRAGLLPRDVLGFLTRADERALLRRVGGGYQFPHSTLQAHIAGRDPDAADGGR